MDSTEVLKLVKQRAINKWGEDYWFPYLVRGYVKAENLATGRQITPVQRRSQISKLFDNIYDQERLGWKTVIYLLDSVDADVEIVSRENVQKRA
jgi:hypothetical protein